MDVMSLIDVKTLLLVLTAYACIHFSLYYVFITVLLGAEGIILALLGNTLLLISFSYYVYITFLGYDSKYHLT